MTTRVGVLRAADGICEALAGLAGLGSDGDEAPGVDGWETTNLLSISAAMARAALLREETRGSHWREDFPERDDTTWAGHVDSTLVDGELRQEFVRAASTDPSTPIVEPR
jgi:L-aspartate oxidase